MLFSRDVYSYAYYGRIAGVYGQNPYVATPADFPNDPLAALVGPKWIDTPAVYGPLFTGVTSLLARWIDTVEGLVATFRLLAIAASLGTVALIAATTRRVWPARAAFAAAAFGLNPVVLFQSAASGHNDLWVALAIAAAFWLLLSGRELPAIAVLTLGTLVKATAGLPLAAPPRLVRGASSAGRAVADASSRTEAWRSRSSPCWRRRSSSCTIRRSGCWNWPVTRGGWRRRGSSGGCSTPSPATPWVSRRASPSLRCCS